LRSILARGRLYRNHFLYQTNRRALHSDRLSYILDVLDSMLSFESGFDSSNNEKNIAYGPVK